mgnify:CR=1 FL=1
MKSSSCLRIASVFCSSTYIKNNGNILFDLSILILQRFVSFLRSSPNPRQVFQSVVDKMLESLLSLLGKFRFSGVDDEKQKISGVIEDILKYRLFHQSHLEGNQNVCKLLKQCGPYFDDIIPMDELSTNSSKETLTFLSYHKLLFQELDYFVKERKVCTLKSARIIFFVVFTEFITPLLKEFEASLHICFLKNELTV